MAGIFAIPIKDRRAPNGNGLAGMLHGISLSGYVQLVDWSSRLIRPGQVSLSAHVPDILTRLQIDAGSWKATLEKLIGATKSTETYFASTTRLNEAAEISASFIHCHAVGIAAIARAGRALLIQSPKGWKKKLTNLSTLDWSRSNTALWEGRAMISGRLSKSSSAVARTGNAVKRHLELELTTEEQAMES